MFIKKFPKSSKVEASIAHNHLNLLHSLNHAAIFLHPCIALLIIFYEETIADKPKVARETA